MIALTAKLMNHSVAILVESPDAYGRTFRAYWKTLDGAHGKLAGAKAEVTYRRAAQPDRRFLVTSKAVR